MFYNRCWLLFMYVYCDLLFAIIVYYFDCCWLLLYVVGC